MLIETILAQGEDAPFTNLCSSHGVLLRQHALDFPSIYGLQIRQRYIED